MIFVAAGTHHQPFDRLLRAAEAAGRALGEDVVFQRGASRLALAGEVHDVLPPARFEELLQRARVIVLHAGSSSFLQARALGRRPIVVPRRPEHGEHVDDHQVRFARSLPAGEAWVCEPEELLAALRAFDEGERSASDRSAAFCEGFARLVSELISS